MHIEDIGWEKNFHQRKKIIKSDIKERGFAYRTVHDGNKKYYSVGLKRAVFNSFVFEQIKTSRKIRVDNLSQAVVS